LLGGERGDALEEDETSTRITCPRWGAASRELLVREARAITWMLVRVVSVAVLITLLVRSAPQLQQIRFLLDTIGGFLVLAPLFTSLGADVRGAYLLGKRYMEARRFDDAVTVLQVLSGLRAKLFDARGEGRYYRAVALRSLNRAAEAEAVFREVAEQGREPWREKASAELVSMGAGTNIGGTGSAPTP
jgi:hypothetical protein